jgi:hypothetical protein
MATTQLEFKGVASDTMPAEVTYFVLTIRALDPWTTMGNILHTLVHVLFRSYA